MRAPPRRLPGTACRGGPRQRRARGVPGLDEALENWMSCENGGMMSQAHDQTKLELVLVEMLNQKKGIATRSKDATGSSWHRY